MNDGIPTVEEKEHRYLERLAAEGSWDYGEYAVQRDVLNDKFHTWIPTFAAYSVAILLHSIVETQLDAFADHMGQKQGSTLRIKEMPGKGVDRSAEYLKRGLSIDVKTDSAWACLKELQWLRNTIVHRGGKPGESPKDQKRAGDLVRKYQPALALWKADGFHEQIWMSMNLCRGFAENIDGFFERLFKASGLPNRHGQLDS